jgi:hypothetical protein
MLPMETATQDLNSHACPDCGMLTDHDDGQGFPSSCESCDTANALLEGSTAMTTATYDECRACGASIHLADDGAWCDDSGACGCGVDEHEPGGFNQYRAEQLARDTPWYDDPQD